MTENYKNDFLEEARELLDGVSDDILQTEANPDDKEIMNSIFRGIHTIKGNAGTFEVDAVSAFAHHLEELLDALRNDELELEADTVDLILAGTDQLGKMLTAFENGEEPEGDAALVEQIQQACGAGEPQAGSEIQEENHSPDEPTTDQTTSSPAFTQEAEEALALAADFLAQLANSPDNPDLLDDLYAEVRMVVAGARLNKIDAIVEAGSKLEGNLTQLRGQESGPALPLAQLQEQLQLLTTTFYALVKGDDPPPAIATSNQDNLDLPAEIAEDFMACVAKGLNIFKITLADQQTVLTPANDPQNFLRQLKEKSQCYDIHSEFRSPDSTFQDFEPLLLHLLPTIYCATDLAADEILALSGEPTLYQLTELGGAEQEALLPVIDEDDIAAFLADAVEHIEAMERAVISYEKTGSRDALDELFRGAHTIKGDADYLQLELTTRFSHALEGVLEKLRRDEIKVDGQVIDLLLNGVDGLKSLIDALAEGEAVAELPLVYGQLVTKAGMSGDEADCGSATSGQDELAALPDDMRGVFLDQVLQHQGILQRHSKSPLAPEDHKIIKRSLTGLERACDFVELPTMNALIARANEFLSGEEATLIEALGDIIGFIAGLSGEPQPVGEILVADGKVSKEDVACALEQQKPVGEILVAQGKVSKEDVNAALSQQKPVGEILVEQGKVAKTEVTQALKKQELMEVAQALKPKARAREIRTMRVDETKIEEFSNLIGEMLVARNSYEYLINGLNGMIKGQQLANHSKALKENLHLFSRLVGDMHHGIMAMRMVPIKSIFQKYIRVVRDISRKQHKEIQLILRGEETEVDKKVIDALSDPLIHLIRNSCDHGIESPAKRKAAGKQEKGTVILSARQQGSNLLIEIIDDGGGVNREKLVAKAMHAGIDVDGMDDSAILGLIFHAGLSTMDQATNLSGRGVGMDVVRSTIDSLGGHVMVESEEGKGTELTMTIPMTMGISVVLLIEAGGQSYGLPFEYVLETIKIKPDALHKAGAGLIFHYRGQVIPAGFLENRLAHGHRPRQHGDLEPDQEVSLVLLQAGGVSMGLIVDRFVRNMEMAVKPLPPALAHIEEISGASILGDGQLILLLNPAKLL